MNQKLAKVVEQNEDLRKALQKSLAHQRHNCARAIAESPTVHRDRDIAVHTRFMHTSDQYSIPIQNWKIGTPFYRERPVQKGRKNAHSAKTLRCHRFRLANEEVEYVMDGRYEKTNLEVPLHAGVFEVVPTRHDEIDLEHKCIWKEYL